MSSGRRVSSVSRSRVHHSYISRVTRPMSSDAVERVQPVDRIKNQLVNASSNFLIASDYFYNNLIELKDEYKKFYRDHSKLEKAIKDMEEDNDKLAEHMKELIEKYNKALMSLDDLDRVLKTNNKGLIEDIIDTFKSALKNIGISIERDYKMSIDEDTFLKKIKKSKDSIEFLFEPSNGLIIQLYKGFKNVKYSSEIGNNEYVDIGKGDISGLIIDEKS
ncbi:MAG: hypothetical protein GX214_07265 [Clostridiales bacterium]|nr:hypothetical protein [Clostridiales bacterium]